MEKIIDTNSTISRGGRVDDYWMPRELLQKRSKFVGEAKGEIDLVAILDRYKLKGFEFGNYVNQNDRRDFVEACNKSLANLQQILGYKDLGFDGRLGIAFGARGNITGNNSGVAPAAHFESGYDMINLTKNRGDKTLAHEYGHAIDYNIGAFANGEQNKQYAALTGGSSIATTLPDNKGGILRYYANQIVDAVKQTESYADLLQKTKSNYWRERSEVFARTFEQWCANALKDKDINDTFLCKSASYYPKFVCFLRETDFKKVRPLIDNFIRKLAKFMNEKEVDRTEKTKRQQTKPTELKFEIPQVYYDGKKEYPNYIVFVKKGKYLETYNDDAEIVSRQLGLILVNKGKTKLVGFPEDDIERYGALLINHNYHFIVVQYAEDANITVAKMPVKEISTDTARFQNRRNAYSEASKNRIVDAWKSGSFDWQKFDPITVWRDTNDGKWYVLSGHSRLAAFREIAKDDSKFAKIPVRVFRGTEKEAVDFALNSNTLSTKETDIERAIYYHNQRDSKEAKDVREAIRQNEGKNAAHIEKLSYLNPDGWLVDQIELLGSDKTNDSTAIITAVAGWVGSARKRYPELTDAHETEIAKYLINGGYGNKSGQISREKDFLDRLDYSFGRWKANGAKPDKPLNFANTIAKSPFEREYEQRLQEARDEYLQAKDEYNRKFEEYNTAVLEGRITDEKRVELLAPKAAWLKRTKEKLLKVQDEKDKIREVATQQKTLFGGGGKMEDLKRNRTQSERLAAIRAKYGIKPAQESPKGKKLRLYKPVEKVDVISDSVKFASEYEIVKKKLNNKFDSAQIKSSKDLYQYFLKVFPSDIGVVESFYVLFLNNQLKVVGWARIGKGGINQTAVDIRVVLKYALELTSNHIAVAHNHPSGNLTPSPQDLDLTRKLNEACKIMNITLIDHLIITPEEYYSFGDVGRL